MLFYFLWKLENSKLSIIRVHCAKAVKTIIKRTPATLAEMNGESKSNDNPF